MVSFRDIAGGLRSLQIELDAPLLVHGSLSAFGEVRGGVETLLGALMADGRGVMAPAFTYKTMLTPETGPENNGIAYGSGRDGNQVAEFFHPAMPVDGSLGVLAEALRRLPQARRSAHPILSFTGVHCAEMLQTQDLRNPLAPVGALSEKGGWVLLLGVGHTRNTSIHYAERLAGRHQFTRWALTPQGVIECPGWPGCSDGFEQAGEVLRVVTRRVAIGDALVQAIPVAEVIDQVVCLIQSNPLALLCNDSTCERCRVVRQAAQAQSG